MQTSREGKGGHLRWQITAEYGGRVEYVQTSEEHIREAYIQDFLGIPGCVIHLRVRTAAQEPWAHVRSWRTTPPRSGAEEEDA